VTAATVQRPPSQPVVRRADVDQSRLPGQPFGRLVGAEVRKSVDTRSGRWVLAALLGLSVIALGWQVWHSQHAPVSLLDSLDTAYTPVGLLLPVLGILAMTAEWSQRTALTTFTLSPRRIPVLLAKLVAALLLALAVVLLVSALTVGATAIAGLVSDGPVDWTFGWRDGVGILVTHGLNVLMGAGFGALLPVTGVALTVFFVAPTIFNLLAPTVLKAKAEWFDVFGSFSRISDLHMHGKLVQSLTAVALWVLLPAVLGLWRSARREVK
jgi:hypothetical protein